MNLTMRVCVEYQNVMTQKAFSVGTVIDDFLYK